MTPDQDPILAEAENIKARRRHDLRKANERLLLREYQAAGISPQPLANGQLPSLSLLRKIASEPKP